MTITGSSPSVTGTIDATQPGQTVFVKAMTSTVAQPWVWTTPLQSYHKPSSPYDVENKRSLDSLLAAFSSGVSSFNTRTGAVTLSSSDVTMALAYTPENQANKVTTLDNSTTHYPSTSAVTTTTNSLYTAIGLKQPRIVGNKPSATGTSYATTDSLTQILANLNSGVIANTTAIAGKQATLTGPGYVKIVSGSPIYVTSIPNGDLANSTITLNSVPTALGGTFTVNKGNTDTTSTGFATTSKLSTYLTKAQVVATYQPLITLTTTGSGSATLISNTLNIPTPAAGATGANPTALAGTSAVPGSATTFMRSDAAPAIDTTAITTRARLTTYQTKAQLNAVSRGIIGNGNSIMFGVGSTPFLYSGANWSTSNGFFPLLAKAVGGSNYNISKGGDQIADIVYYDTFPNLNPQGGATDPLGILEALTNDVTTYNTNTSKQNIANRSLLAAATWMAIPKASKTFAQAGTATGFAADNNLQSGLGETSTTNGNTLSMPITTNASSYIYIWYRAFDGNTGTFTVKIDGTLQNDPYTSSSTINAFGDGGATIATQNGGTTSVFCLRMAVASSGSHTVLVTNTGTTGQTVTIYGVGTNSTSSTSNPYVIMVSPNHQNNANDAVSTTYAGFMSTLVTQLAGDGLNVIYADTRTALGTAYSTYYYDALHPNNAGHLLMYQTILGVTPSQFLTGNTLPNINSITQNILTSIPINPELFSSPNEAKVYSTTLFNPGIKWGESNHNIYYTNVQPATGITMAGANAGSTPIFSVGTYTAPSNVSPNTPPPIQNMALTITGGSIIAYPNSSTQSTTMTLQSGTVLFGGVGAYVGNAWSSGFSSNYFMQPTASTSGANQNSPQLFLSGRYFKTQDNYSNTGWQNIIASGTDPTSYLTFIHTQTGTGTGLTALDLTQTTNYNKLGFGLFSNSTTSFASMRLPSGGVDPTSPVIGDFWDNSAVIKYYDGATEILANTTGVQTISNKTLDGTNNVPVILATITGINAKTTGTTALYTVPTGKTLIVTAVMVRCTAASAITAGPAADVGDNTIGAASIYANAAINGLTGTTKDFGYSTVGMSSQIAAASIVNFNINTAATGTSQTIAVDLIGYLR